MKNVVKIKKLTKKFSEDEDSMIPNLLGKGKMFTAVDNVSFEVKEKEIFGILGPNGCGKSTLIRMLSTLVTPDKGKATVFGKDTVKDAAEVKTMINRVSVDASFFKRLSAYENLMYAGRIYGLDGDYIDTKSQEILKGIGFNLKKYKESIQNFSRGMQQKIAITRGFLTTPMLLLLDEPTTGLDPKSKLDVQKFINVVRSNDDVTIILTSHDMDETERLCDRIAIMDKGKIIALGSANELKKLLQKDHLYEVVSKDSEIIKKKIKGMKGIIIREFGKDKLMIEAKTNITKKIIEKINGCKIEKFHTIEPTLEDVFIHLTGKKLEGNGG